MNQHAIFDESLVLTFGERLVDACRQAGIRHVRDASEPLAILDHRGRIQPQLSYFGKFTILVPEGHEDLRDTIAVNLGDDRCKWAYVPEDVAAIGDAIRAARPMWTDEIARLDDIPEPGPIQTYETGFYALDQHGLRITLPAFMPVIGPYGSGKSVWLRQLLVNLWRKHGWKFLLTSFEEKIKPRFHRDLRRNLIGKPVEHWTDEDIARADIEIQKCAVFLRRKRGTVLDMNRLLNRIDFAVRVYGVKVVAIDPVNEIEHQVPRGESKTDYMGRFIMALKQLADDHNLLMICAAHPPKDGVEKRLAKNGLLTLNDGADTAHWGNKADLGICVWRNIDGPTMLHIDKVKDHESMGKPTLAEMTLNRELNQFIVDRVGYELLHREGVE